jgi:hypothetical protein
MQIFTARTSSSEARFEIFVDRLHTKDKMRRIAEELRIVEKILLSQVA